MPSAPAEPELVELTIRPGVRSPQSSVAVIERHRRTIIFAAALGALSGAIAANVLPATYESKGRLFVVPADDPTAAHGTNAFDLANATLPLVVTSLHSRRVLEETVERLRLDTAWGVPARVARRRLDAGLTVATDRKANLITVSFEDRVPARARAVVGAIAERATALAIDLWAQRNRAHRRQLEADLAQVGAELTAAEDAFRGFRERTHIVDLASQIKATVEHAAALERLRIDKALNLRFARAFGDSASIEVQKGVRERAAVSVELEALRVGTSDMGPLLPLDQLPKLELEYTRLKRAVDEHAARHEMLALKVSELVAAEARPGGLAEVVDPPDEPQVPSGPSAVKLMLGGALMAALVAVAVVLVRARRRRAVGVG
jgi:uncharacterized protein involved in exopolysaccharide biosynthesis